MFNSKSWNYRRGDIYLADLGAHTGHIQGGARPVVVIQNDYGNRFSSTLIVVPLTTEIKKSRHANTLHLAASARVGQAMHGPVRADSHHQQVPNHPLFRSCPRYSYGVHQSLPPREHRPAAATHYPRYSR